jgi:hypothetical protein
VRYLTRSFAAGAIRRGAIVDQLLGGYGDGDRHGLRVLTVQPDGEAFCLYVHEILDVGGTDFADLTEFPPWDDESGDAAVCSQTPDALLSYAEQQLGADATRWVNGSMLDDEYLDYVRAGRPANLTPPG